MSRTEDSYHVHIDGKENPLQLNLKEVWRYRDLIVLFTKRTLTLTYKQTILGPAWLVLTPFLTSVVYAVVFKGIAGINTNGIPGLLFYLCSNGLWTLFASSLKRNSATFVVNARVFAKVYFPRLTISISTMLNALIEFLIVFAMIVIILIYYLLAGEVEPAWKLLWLLPFVVLIAGAMGLGLGVLVSSLTTKYRDLRMLVDFGVMLWMFATPVVYPLSQLEGSGILYKVMLWNPMTAPMELFRKIMLGQGYIDPISVISTLVFTAAALLAGILIFNRVERTFIDTV